MTEWRNRIVEYGEATPEDLLANPRNWRIHPKMQQDALSGVLDEIGWVDDVIVNKRTGFVVDGHLRVSLAISKGNGKVPVKYVDLSEEEEMVILATIDPIAAMAATDKDKLSEVFDVIQSDNEQVQQLLDDIAKKERIEREVDEDPGAQIDKADELQEKWQVERGQVWQIGNHRLMCGDSTSEEDVAALMDGESLSLVWTDPPYGVNYGEKLDDANPIAHRVRHIENDDLQPEQLEQLVHSALKNASDNAAAGAAIYVASPAKGDMLSVLVSAFKGSGFAFRWHLVWLKDQIVLSRADYHFKHENILYGWKSNATHYFTVDRKQASVFEVDRPKASEEHPTMKPPELIGAMIQNSSKRGAIVYDSFLGSGSTLIACEQNKRKGYGMEIEPKYCAVTLERMSEMGLVPELV